MICVPGHGRGVDDIVGIDEQGRDRTDKAGYQHDFAIQVAEAGMAAVAIEPMAFGCRRDPLNARQGLSQKGCEPAAGGALLLGETMIGWRVWDVMRTLDYIATRPELDASRVGCMGISGGGTATLFAAALEPRIRAAMVSGYLNTFRDSVGSLAHCIDNYVPGILNWAEMHDIAGLIAPRPLFVESGEKDNIFPIAASVESFKQVREIYGVFQAADRVEQEVFPGRAFILGKARHSVHGGAPLGAARRTAATLRLRLSRAHEGAGEAVLDLWRQAVDIDSALGQERARIVDLVDAPGLDIDVGKARRSQFRGVLGFLEGARDAAHPQFHAAADVGRDARREPPRPTRQTVRRA